ncbi:MAG TPA: fumarylacetoacetase [Actinomycetota bacterium]|nr:fumarylacetoacetase [Actinomycetota bacterium]
MSDRIRTWVPNAEDSGYPIESLPLGIFRAGGAPRAGAAIGDSILDLTACDEDGLLPVPRGTFAGDTLNGLLSLGAGAWRALRARLAALLAEGNDEIRLARPGALVSMREATMQMPVAVGDYVDFYSSIQHATNLGRIFRPDAEPLLANWRHLPVGYHGRSGTIVVSGTPVRRPAGQRKPPDADAPSFGPSVRLDFELELGFVTGDANMLGRAVPVAAAEEHIFGVVLVNDWSARDIQAWEYQPLGPFLGKSFATSISSWVVPLDALAPYRVPAPPQEPPPLPYLRCDGDRVLDADLSVELTAGGGAPTVIARTNARNLYWTMAQQLAHATVNGATARAGDLFASGTISGSEAGTFGSMIELSWNGAAPVPLQGGEERAWLEDGDTVVMRGVCGGYDGLPRIALGEVSGTVLPAES